MITVRWIVHCSGCGYLTRPEYPAQWSPDPSSAYRFHHKREAACVVAEYSHTARKWLHIEPLKTAGDAIFD